MSAVLAPPRKVTYEGYLTKWILTRWRKYPLVRINAGLEEGCGVGSGIRYRLCGRTLCCITWSPRVEGSSAVVRICFHDPCGRCDMGQLPWKLTAIHAGDWLVKLRLMAVILCLWRR